MTPEEEIARLRALLKWIQSKSREAMWTLPGTRKNRQIRDQCLSEINAATMSVQNFGKAVLATFILGCTVGGLLGYTEGRSGAYDQGAKDEQSMTIEMLASNQPCVDSLKICYPELKSAESYTKQGFVRDARRREEKKKP